MCEPLQAILLFSPSPIPVIILQSVNTMFFPIFVIYVSIPTNSYSLITDINYVFKDTEIVLRGVILRILIVVEMSTIVARAPP